MNLLPSSIKGLYIAETRPMADHRGAFTRLYCQQTLESAIDGRQIVQINHSLTSHTGTVRGLHYQRPPQAEMKLVRCIQGRVWDLAVDLRAGSPTFLRWQAEELSAENARMMIIPEGCAHGFQVLEPNSELLYLHTAMYSAEAESGIAHDDPRVAISWPLPVTNLSERDQGHSTLSKDFSGIADLWDYDE